MVARAAVLLARHWPTLLVLWLLGWLGSEAVTALAIETTRLHNVAGLVVLALAPVSTMAAVMISLRVLRSSSDLAPVTPSPGDLPRSARAIAALDSIGSVLVPFLAVYMSQGALGELVTDYSYRVWEAGTIDRFAGRESDRTGMPDAEWVMGTVAGIAFAVRWLIRWRRSRRAAIALPVAWAGAWVEAVWLMLLVMFVNVCRTSGWSWVQGRRVVHAGREVYTDATGATGWLGDAVRQVWTWITSWIAHLDQIVLAPLALLTIGAVVYGSAIQRPPPARLPGEDVVRTRLGRSRLASSPWGSRLREARPSRTVLLAARRAVRGRFQPLVDGLRLVIHAGVAPMMLFCVAYQATQTATDWLGPVWRRLIGPRELDEWRAISPVLSVATGSIAGVAGIVLIGAAVERLVTVGDSGVAEPQVDDVVAVGVADA